MTGLEGPVFRREELLGGLPARRASTLLFAIERRTAALARRSRQAIAAYQSPRTEAERDQAFLEALATGREERLRPRIQDLERHAPRWADLVPPDPSLRAATARLMAQAYPLSHRRTPRLRAALGLDDPAVAEAYERLHGEPLDGIWRPRLPLRERVAWLRARLTERLESLPPFWMAFALTFTETVGAGILALPVALAGVGVGPALVLLVILGLANLLTVGALAEGIVRDGSMRYGTSYFGQLVGHLLGRPAALGFQVALVALSVVALVGLYVAFGSVLEGATGIASGLWVALILAVDVLIIRRGRLEATMATAMAIGIVNLLLITLIAIVSLPHIDAANLTRARVPILDGTPLDPAIVGLVFGVVLVAYFGHTSAANAAKVVLEADPTGRSLVTGNLAAFVSVIGVYALLVTAVIGAVGPDPLLGYPGTALTPLAEVVGPVVSVLGSLFVLLAIGLGTVYFCLGLHNQVIELLPTPRRSLAGQGSPPTGLMSRLAQDRRLRLALGLAPTVAVALVVEILLVLEAASFAGSFALIGTLTLPLLAGVFPMLMLVAARRRGEYPAAFSLGWAGHPVVVVAVVALFLAALFAHAVLVWEAPLERLAALAVGSAILVLVLRIGAGGAFRPRTVLEVRHEGRDGRVRHHGLVAAGQPLGAPATVTDGRLSVPIPPEAPRELHVWVHRVTAEGVSVGLPGRAEIEALASHRSTDGPPTRGPVISLHEGRASTSLPEGAVRLSLTLEEAAIPGEPAAGRH